MDVLRCEQNKLFVSLTNTFIRGFFCFIKKRLTNETLEVTIAAHAIVIIQSKNMAGIGSTYECIHSWSCKLKRIVLRKYVEHDLFQHKNQSKKNFEIPTAEVCCNWWK